MGRRAKLPDHVNIQIPKDIVELYEKPILEVLLTPKEAEIAEQIITHIKENGRLWPSDWVLFCPNKSPAEKKNYYRTLKKLLALGILGRGKEGSFILSDEFTRKLTVMLEKTLALIGKTAREI
ncbi:hypothetical protein APY94_00130 [Thermococcus celericrescens]|uniref:Uncharacterized protein n=1 Tax=Thermococcus celericrescens TaxID=227598 RepID=A0A100XZW4_9EURY|nr:hypothetical protein [Thermococcus celericrescens]KUH34818.1 hypothetical protein APY94_00130 [Thermococcus celericrescens]